MKRTAIFGMVVAGLLAIVSSASAQTSCGPVVSPGFGFGGYGGFGYHSSTYEEGVLRGLGDLTRSVGQANYLNSLASINQQEAVSRYIDNRQKYAETFFEMRQLNRAAREAERAQPLSAEQYVQLARAQAPNRLNEAEYDRVLGRVQWPAVLQGELFAAERAALEHAFRGRSAHDVGVNSAFYANVQNMTQSMQQKLQENRESLSAMQLIGARNFLQGLAYESQLPQVAPGLASR
jgi:hypothetical protein